MNDPSIPAPGQEAHAEPLPPLAEFTYEKFPQYLDWLRGADLGDSNTMLHMQRFMAMIDANENPTYMHQIEDVLRSGHGWSKERFKSHVAFIKKAFRDAIAEAGGRRQFRKEIAALLEHCVLIESTKMVADLRLPGHLRIMPLEAFIASKKNYPKDGNQAMPLQWLEHENRKTAYGTKYHPGMPDLFQCEEGLSWVNLYHPAKMIIRNAPVPTHLDVFLKHLEFLFTKEHRGRQDLFIKWMAFTYLYPGERAKFTPLLVARMGGMGRGWLVELLELLVGPHNASRPGMKVIHKGWGDPFQNVTLCCVEELKEDSAAQGSFTLIDGLKTLLEADRLHLDMKGGKNETTQVFMNFLLMTNYRDSIRLRAGERRLWVHETPGAPRDPEYYDRIYAWLKDPMFVASVAAYLRQVDLSEFAAKGNAPMTPEKERMIYSTSSPVEHAFMSLLAEGQLHMVTEQEVFDRVRDRQCEQRGGGPTYQEMARGDQDSESRKLIKLHLNRVYGGNQFRIGERKDNFRPVLYTPDSNPKLLRHDKKNLGRIRLAYYLR